MKAKGIFGIYVAVTSDNAHAAKNDPAIEYQPVVHYSIDDQQSWLARFCAVPAVRINWRERR